MNTWPIRVATAVLAALCAVFCLFLIAFAIPGSARRILSLAFIPAVLAVSAAFRDATPRPRCPACNAYGLRRTSVLRSLFHSFARCVFCGAVFKRRSALDPWQSAGWSVRRTAWGWCWQKPRTKLPLEALQFEIDDSTCGQLLGTKRQIDLSALIHPSQKEPPTVCADKGKAVDPKETTHDRLLRSSRRRHMVREETPTVEGPPTMWDRWLDG